jgi:hypothetical protein
MISFIHTEMHRALGSSSFKEKTKAHNGRADDKEKGKSGGGGGKKINETHRKG